MNQRKIVLIASMFYGGIAFAQNTDYPIQNVAFTDVTLSDKFWAPRIETNRTLTIPASFDCCQTTGRIQNFVSAATKTPFS
jgi:hypothetical protein